MGADVTAWFQYWGGADVAVGAVGADEAVCGAGTKTGATAGGGAGPWYMEVKLV